jgi:hypothetical protein
MRVSDVEIVDGEDGCRLQARVTSERDQDHDEWFAPFDLWFQYPEWCRPYLRVENGDPFVAALLVAAMRTSEQLSVPAPVSPMLLRALPEIQAIYAAFDRRAISLVVDADARDDALSVLTGVRRVGLFFSLGVDSFYSLLKNRHDQPPDRSITHLISVQGFDAIDEEGDFGFSPMMLANLHQVAGETGATLLPVQTNIRRVTAWLAPWTIVHGGAMAAIALALNGMFERVLIAASASYDVLGPWGTHPLLDPLWSTETLTVIHDGCEKDTIDKTWFNTRSDLFLDTVRVCPGYGAEYNCGRCLKCLRTTIDLWKSGHLDRCRTLPHRIDPVLLGEALKLGDGPVHRAAFRRRLDYLEAAGALPEVQEVVRAHLAGAGSLDARRRRRRWARWPRVFGIRRG